MKPVAPSLPERRASGEQPTLLSEIRRLCDTKASDERITLPPPAEDAPPVSGPAPSGASGAEGERDTIPSPPPSASRRRPDATGEMEAVPVPSTIPGPPRLPTFAV